MITRILKLYGINILMHFVIMSLYFYCHEEHSSVFIAWVLPFSILFWAPITTITSLIGFYITKNRRWIKSIILITISIILFQAFSFFIADAILYLDKNGFFPSFFYYDTGDGFRLDDGISVTIQYIMASILLLISMVVINAIGMKYFLDIKVKQK